MQVRRESGETRLPTLSDHSPLPEAFHNLPRDCLERVWDALVEEGSGVYLSRSAFQNVFGVIDEEVKVAADPADTPPSLAKYGQQFHPRGSPLDDLFETYALDIDSDYIDSIEVLGAIILASNQLARREKALLLRDYCMLFSVLNVACVINGASVALTGKRKLTSEQEIANCEVRDLNTWIDHFPHRPIPIRVQILSVAPHVAEENLKIIVNGQAFAFPVDGIIIVTAKSGTPATIGSSTLFLKEGKHMLKNKSENDYMAEVLVAELDGLDNVGDETTTCADDEDEEDFAFQQRAKAAGIVAGKEGYEMHQNTAIRAIKPQAELCQPLEEPYRLAATLGFNTTVAPCQVAKGDIIYAVGNVIALESTAQSSSAEEEQSARKVRYFYGHATPVTALAVHPNGRWIFSASQNSRKILAWDTGSLKLLFSIDSVITSSRMLCISQCGRGVFCMNPSDNLYAFYEINERGPTKFVHSARLPLELKLCAAELLNSKEVILAGSHVVRLTCDGSLVRMRWGKTAPKATQTSLAVVPSTRTCVTASRESGHVYIWSNDVCMYDRKLDEPVCAVSIGQGRGAFVCGLADGTLCLLSSRNLEPLPGNLGSSAQPLLQSSISSAWTTLVTGASALLGINSKGVLISMPYSDLMNPQHWQILQEGHGGDMNSSVTWAWVSPSMLVTAGSDAAIHLWQVMKKANQEEATLHKIAQFETAGLVRSIAGWGKRIFVALDNHQIQCFDLGNSGWTAMHTKSSFITCSLARIDMLAASDDLLAACCFKTREVEVRSISGGKLVARLKFDAGVLRKPIGLQMWFGYVERMDNVILQLGGSMGWDTKTWQSLTEIPSGAKKINEFSPQAPASVFSIRNLDTALHFMERMPNVKVDINSTLVPNSQMPTYQHRVIRLPQASESGVNTSKMKSKTDTGAATGANGVICTNAKTVRAIAYHASSASTCFALATDQNYIEVNDYKLNVNGVVQALAFDEEKHVAVSTTEGLYIFDWISGVLCNSVRVANRCTLGLEFVAVKQAGTNEDKCLALVDQQGGIQIWHCLGRSLFLDSRLSRADAGACCLTRSGIYGSLQGSLCHITEPGVVKATCNEEGVPVLALFEDQAGFVSGCADGSLKFWTLALQEIPVRKTDRLKFSQPVVAIFRTPKTAELILQTADGHIYANKDPLQSFDINACLHLRKPPALPYHMAQVFNAAEASPTLVQKQFKLENGNILTVHGAQLSIRGGGTSEEYKLNLDDSTKYIALSSNQAVLAIVSKTNDLYIIDANTVTLLYFWPSSEIVETVQTLRFNNGGNKATTSLYGQVNVAQKSYGASKLDVQMFEQLLVNGTPFSYKTSF